jgi:HEPN domain-containing protein
MRALTREWVAKAEGDFHTARREARVRQAPNYDAVCFHCQQSAEKYLKAFLQEQRQNFLAFTISTSFSSYACHSMPSLNCSVIC